MPEINIPDDILQTIWVVKLSPATTAEDITSSFSKIAPVRQAYVTKINENYVGLLEFETFEGKKLVLDQGNKGTKFSLRDGTQAMVRDSRTSIRLFLQAQVDNGNSSTQLSSAVNWSYGDLLGEQEIKSQQNLNSLKKNSQTQNDSSKIFEDIKIQSTKKLLNNKEQGIDIEFLESYEKEDIDAQTLNQSLKQPNNENLFLDTKNNLSGNDALESLRPPLIEDHQITQLIENITKTIFSSKKFLLVKEISEKHSLTCEQCRRILTQFRISFEQKQILTEYLYKHIQDRDNIDVVLNAFDFDMDREIVRKILEMIRV